MPTIYDQTSSEDEDPLSLEGERERQHGIINRVTDIEEMIRLGSIALRNPDELLKLLQLPSFLRKRTIDQNGDSMDRSGTFQNHLFL